MSGNVPYAEYKSEMGIYRAIHNKQPPKRPAVLSHTDQRSDPMWSLLLECWDHDPSVRPDASSVKELVGSGLPPCLIASAEPTSA